VRTASPSTISRSTLVSASNRVETPARSLGGFVRVAARALDAVRDDVVRRNRGLSSTIWKRSPSSSPNARQAV